MLTSQFTANRNHFRRLASQEGMRYFKHWFAEAAQAGAPRIEAKYLVAIGKVSIRAQVFDKKRRLLNDYLVV